MALIGDENYANMKKLHFLNTYFTQRFMTVVQEIMKVVEDTLAEYQKENDRTKRANDNLRRRLREAGLDAESGFPRCSQPAASPLSVDRTVTEKQEWPSTLREDTELTAMKFDQHRGRQGEVELSRMEPDTPGSIFPLPRMKRECSQESLNQSVFHTSPCEKRDHNQDSLKPPDLKMQIVSTDEVGPLPNVMLYQVKTETEGVDYSTSEQPNEPLPSNIFNLGRQTVESENSGRVNVAESGGPMSPSETEHSKGQLSMLRGESSLSCVYCGKVFFHASRLKLHLRIHTEERSFHCTVCGKRFSQSRHLTAHQRVHTGKKPYCCNVCGKRFNYSGKFKEHQRIHTGERPYRCTFCGKYFSQSGHLKAHVRIHTGEKPYRCPVCGSCFSQLSQIKRHLLTHTEEISFGNHSLGE